MSAKRAELLKQFPPEFKDIKFLHDLTFAELDSLHLAILNYGYRRCTFGKDLEHNIVEQDYADYEASRKDK